jgi:uncharacterized protein
MRPSTCCHNQFNLSRITAAKQLQSAPSINATGVNPRPMADLPLVKVDDSIDASGAMVVSCFPTVSMVSNIVAHYLVERLELQFVGGVRDARLPAVCLVQDGEPLPPIRIYAGEPNCTVEGCDKLIVVLSDIQVHGRLALPLTEALFAWSKSAGIGSAILIDAFAHGVESPHELVDDDDTDETLLGIGATEESRKKLGEMGIPLLKHGVVGGMTGVMMGEGRRRGIDICAILAEANPQYPDARAAARIIEKLDMLFPAVKLDAGPLLEEAGRIEEQIKAMMKHQLSASEELGEDGGTSAMLYG